MLAAILQVYDFIKILLFLFCPQDHNEVQDNFRHMLTISAYLIGITLNIFSN